MESLQICFPAALPMVMRSANAVIIVAWWQT